jgi:hypothetical protein
MATTTNYGWETPDDTDLVKDGADAIRELGQDVDTSLFGITSGKNVGLVHINTTSLSAITSTTISSVFTSAFANYRVIVTGAGSLSQDLFVRMASSGTPDAGSNYGFQTLKASGGTVAGGFNGSATRFETIAYENAQLSSAILEIAQPQLATATAFQSSGGRPDQIWTVAGRVATTTQYDGLNLFTGSGTFTGTVRIYGYRNS